MSDHGHCAAAAGPEGGRRWEGIQLIRGVVCLSIVAMHYCTGLPGPLAVDPRWFQFRPGVESFFVLTGFFVRHALRPAGRLSVAGLVRRRVITVAVPFWVVLLADSAFAAGRNLARGMPPLDPAALAVDLLFLNDFAGQGYRYLHLWSLAGMMQLLAATVAGYWVVRRVYLALGRPDYQGDTLRLLEWAALLLLASTLVAEAAVPADRWPLWGWRLLQFLPFAAAGFVAYRAPWWVVVGVAAALAAAAGWSELPSRFAWGGVVVLLLGVVTRRPPYLPRTPLSAVGEMSYAVYLTHPLVAQYVHMLRYRGHLTGCPNEYCVAAAVVLTLLASYLLHTRVTVPLGRRARAVDYRA